MADLETTTPTESLVADFDALFSGGGKEIQSEPENPQPDTAPEAEEQPEIQDSEGVDEAEAVETTDKADSEAQEDIEGEEVKAGHFNVTIDGETKKVTLDELRSGYLRQSDYTRKTSEVAEERKSLQAEAEQYRQRTIAVLAALDERYKALDPVSMLKHQLKEAEEIGDGETANRIRYDILQTEKVIEQNARALAWEKEQEAQRKGEEETKTNSAFIEEQRKALGEKMPWVFSSEEGSKKFQSVVNKAMAKVGLTADDVKKPDHRNAMLAYYAGKYLESLDKKPQVAAAIKGKAVMPKPGGRNADAGKSTGKDAALRQFDANPNAEGSLAGVFKTFGVVR